MKANNILILHGWNASPDIHFFPKAKEKFEKMGYRVEIPSLAGGYFPSVSQWVKTIADFHPDRDWILIGHSLGGVALLRYLEQASQPINHAILLATPSEAMHFEGIKNFFAEDFNWKKIKSNCRAFDLIYETNDPVVEKEHGQEFAKKLKGNLIIIPGGMHLHNLDLKLLAKLLKA